MWNKWNINKLEQHEIILEVGELQECKRQEHLLQTLIILLEDHKNIKNNLHKIKKKIKEFKHSLKKELHKESEELSDEEKEIHLKETVKFGIIQKIMTRLSITKAWIPKNQRLLNNIKITEHKLNSGFYNQSLQDLHNMMLIAIKKSNDLKMRDLILRKK